MYRFQTLALPVLVALSSVVSAADIISGGINGNACPNDWTNIQYKDTQRCCYGSLNVESNDPYCCVHDFSFSDSGLGDTDSDCFPLCTITTRKLPTITQKSCETKIAFTTDDYSSLVSAASASITGTSKSSDSDATTTTSGSETDSGNKATATKDSKETSTNMAGPAVTAEGLVLGGALAAALFAL